MKGENRVNSAEQKIVSIRRQIASIDEVCSGHLRTRTKVCGQPGCRCSEDPKQRHGPYHEWSRRDGGRQVVTVIDAEVAQRIAQAIENYRTILALLRQWEHETARKLIGQNRHKQKF